MKKCLVSGSFDPITNGHLDIIKRACDISDIVLVGVFNNEEKEYLFDLTTRVHLCKIATTDLEKVQVCGSSGMVCDFCKANNIDFIVRGFRNEKDYAYETEMAQFNYDNSGIVTYLLPAGEDFINVSSSNVRNIINNDTKENVSKYLPKEVIEQIRRIKNA